jgi:hypothetical protein
MEFKMEKNKKNISNKTPKDNTLTKRHWWSSKKVKIILLIIILLILAFLAYKYVENVKEKAYIEGGKKAISFITQDIKTTGGVILREGNQTLVLSKYEKTIKADISTVESVEDNNEVNSTSE